ncbi:MAG: hypothetical protein M0C28_29595 [Candidatus Moduliflexus flocculans]|nr:hypothetical protein [Candidatus Moduliflexus flocculans]
MRRQSRRSTCASTNWRCARSTTSSGFPSRPTRFIKKYWHVHARGKDPGGGFGRQGFALAVGHPAPSRLPGRWAVSRSGHRRRRSAIRTESHRLTREVRRSEHGLKLHVVDVEKEYGHSHPCAGGYLASRAGQVRARSADWSKRHEMNRIARDLGYDVLATGHNLDDEAAVLFGNTLDVVEANIFCARDRFCRNTTGWRARSSRCAASTNAR